VKHSLSQGAGQDLLSYPTMCNVDIVSWIAYPSSCI